MSKQLLVLICLICIGHSLVAQPVSVGLSISETGQAEVSTWSSDPFNAFSAEGAPSGSFFFTIPEQSRAARRKQKRAQKAYDNQEVVYIPDGEMPQIQSTQGISYSPFAAAQNTSSFFGFFMPFGLQSSINTWQEHNYAVRGYNCNGTDWYSNHYINYRSNEQDYLDSAIWGSSYYHGDSIVKKPQVLWKYWYNEHDQFSRIEIRSLEYPEENGPNHLRAIIQFNYNANQALQYIISFTDTIDDAVFIHPEEFARSIDAVFYQSHDSISSFIRHLEFPERGQALQGFIAYHYDGEKLLGSSTYSNDWLAITKDSLVYQNDKVIEMHHFLDSQTSHIYSLYYDARGRVDSIKSLSYVENDQRDTGVETLNLALTYKTRKEIQKLQNAQTQEYGND